MAGPGYDVVRAITKVDSSIEPQLFVVVILSVCLAIDINYPLNESITDYSSMKIKTFKYDAALFLSAQEADQRCILYDMIQKTDIPFSLEDTHWSLNHNWKNPQCETKIKNLDEIMDNLLIAARGTAEGKNDKLRISIAKLYEFHLRRFFETKKCLNDWVEESRNCMEFVRCVQRYRDDNLVYDNTYRHEYLWVVDSRRKETSDNINEVFCSICIEKSEKESTPIIQTRCSHSFHVSCIFQWFLINPTCPLCRADQMNLVLMN